MVVTEKDKKKSKAKSSILLTCIRSQGREIYNTFTSSQNKEKFDHNAVYIGSIQERHKSAPQNFNLILILKFPHFFTIKAQNLSQFSFLYLPFFTIFDLNFQSYVPPSFFASFSHQKIALL